MAKDDKLGAIEFTPVGSDEGRICSGCPIKKNCSYADGMRCASIRAIRLHRAAELKSVRKCTLPDQYRTYDILGGMTVARWFDKKRCKVVAKIRELHPIGLFKPDRNSCKCAVTLKVFDRTNDIHESVNILVDFEDLMMLDYGYADMPAVRKRLADEIYQWYIKHYCTDKR